MSSFQQHPFKVSHTISTVSKHLIQLSLHRPCFTCWCQRDFKPTTSIPFLRLWCVIRIPSEINSFLRFVLFLLRSFDNFRLLHRVFRRSSFPFGRSTTTTSWHTTCRRCSCCKGCCNWRCI